jgi:hypothetical protein
MANQFDRTTREVRDLVTALGGNVTHLEPKGWSVEFPADTRTLGTFTTNVPCSDSIALMRWELPNGVRVHYDAGSSDDSHVLAVDRNQDS